MEFVIKTLKENLDNTIKKRIEEDREGLEQLAKMVKLPKDIKCEPIDIEGIPAEWISSPDINKDHIILYLHGGGYVSGSLNTHRELVSRISRSSRARILQIKYRLAPENPFPAGLEDATKAYQWLIDEQGIPAGNIIIAGDSAGGGLTLATLLNLRDKSISLPVAGVCLSPWTDLDCTGDSFKKNVKIDFMCTPEGLILDARLYLGDTDPHDPLASPLYADFHGLPPLLIEVGTDEILYDDSVRVAERAKEHNVEVQLDIWESLGHVFQAFAAFAPEGQKGIEKVGEFVQKIFK